MNIADLTRTNTFSLCKDSGFTLIELAIALFVVGLMVAVNAPNLSKYTSRARLNGAARQVAGDLISGRMEAIKQNCNVIVSFKNQYQYWVVIDKNSNNVHDGDESIIIKDLRDEYPGVKNIVTDTKNVFNSKGSMRRMRTIKLENAGGDVRIRVSISGRIKIG